MKRSYRLPESDETTLELGRKLVNVLIEANVTFGKAIAALDAAEDILENETRPTSVSFLHQGGCKSNP